MLRGLPVLLSALCLLRLSAAANYTVAKSSAESQAACDELGAVYPHFLLWPNSTDYNMERIRYWDIRSNLSPACIFLAQNASHVVGLVQICKSNNAQFAIRGGGHMTYPGSNNIDGGVLVTLNALNTTKVSVDNSSIEVGPGNTWFNVYGALEPYGRYAIGGRLKTIGVPGLTLIGGFNYLNNKYGFAMDNTISYDVVLGNGSQVVANRTSHPDLFWALKGGANNFGIVTKFVLKTIYAPKVSTTIQQYAEGQVPAYVKAVCDLVQTDDGSIGAGGVFTVQYNATTKVLLGSILGVQEGTESPPFRFAKFSSLETTVRVDNVTTPAQWASKLDSPNQLSRNQFAHRTMKPDADQLMKFINMWKSSVDQIADVEGLYPTFVMNLYPSSANAIAKTNGVGNVWGRENVTEPYILFQLATGWAKASDDIRVTQWSKYLMEHMHSLNREIGIASEFVYMGDTSDIQIPWTGFPAQNVQRLRNVSRMYDPDLVFQRLNWGGFKLGF